MAKKKIKIDPIVKEQVSSIYQWGMALAKAGDERIEKIKCIFTLSNDTLIYFYPMLDFIELPPSQIQSIETFHLLQPFSES